MSVPIAGGALVAALMWYGACAYAATTLRALLHTAVGVAPGLTDKDQLGIIRRSA